MVGHYWLRKPELAPNGGDRRRDSPDALSTSRPLPRGVHGGSIRPPTARQVYRQYCASASAGRPLGPMFVADAAG